MDARFGRWIGGLRIGPRFFERRGALRAGLPPPRGVVDRMADLDNPDVDCGRIHPAVVTFFEDSARYDIRIQSRWRFPFSLAWALMRPLMLLVGQLALPWRAAVIRTEVLALDRERDGRSDARAVLRTYADSGAAMQVIAYATWSPGGGPRGDDRYMSACFPLPCGQLAGLLRLEPIAEDDEGRLSVALTSSATRWSGVWFLLGRLAVRAPLAERLELYVPDCAPDEVAAGAPADVAVIGRHTQALFGIRVVTHRYWFVPVIA